MKKFSFTCNVEAKNKKEAVKKIQEKYGITITEKDLFCCDNSERTLRDVIRPLLPPEYQ